MEQQNTGVLVYIEQRGGQVEKVSLELLGKGRELATKLNKTLLAVVIGHKMSACALEAVYHGADLVYVVDEPLLSDFMSKPYTKALMLVTQAVNPEIVLIGATSIGRDIAPRLSVCLHTGLTADCTSLEIDETTQGLLMTRPAFGGNLMATITCPNHRPQMSSVRPGVMLKPVRDTTLKGEVVRFPVKFMPEDKDVEILVTMKETAKKVKIEDAKVLVSGGRGMGSKDNMALLYTLADALHGEVSGTRAVIESGWLDKDLQVGQTGKTVRPDLYLACGISGAIQHVSGMEDSGLIIAINLNPNSPIFEVADLSLVGDVNKILPLLTKELLALKTNS